MERFKCCRSGWDALWSTGPDKLPTLAEVAELGVAVGEGPEGQFRIAWGTVAA